MGRTLEVNTSLRVGLTARVKSIVSPTLKERINKVCIALSPQLLLYNQGRIPFDPHLHVHDKRDSLIGRNPQSNQ